MLVTADVCLPKKLKSDNKMNDFLTILFIFIPTSCYQESIETGVMLLKSTLKCMWMKHKW